MSNRKNNVDRSDRGLGFQPDRIAAEEPGWKPESPSDRSHQPDGQASGGPSSLASASVWCDRSAISSALLTLFVFAVDASLPLGVASAVPYSFAVLLATRASPRWFGPALAVLCCVLTVGKMFVFTEHGTTEHWKVVANRSLAVFAIGLTTYLGAKRRRADERRQAAEEQTRIHLADLAHLNRLNTAGQLAAALAHELNQPLAAVSLQAEIASRLLAGTAPEEVRTALHEITEQSQRAAAIVRSLREFMRKVEPQRNAVDLEDVIHTVVHLSSLAAQRSGIALRTQLCERPAVWSGDRIQLEQVLLNLVQNAFDAIAEAGATDGRVDLCTVRQADWITISVRDNGIGLPKARDRIFEPFFSTKSQGMGLGLAISQSIVAAYGGQLTVLPNSERGATFAVTLRLARCSEPERLP